jgi:hypothetical protein
MPLPFTKRTLTKAPCHKDRRFVRDLNPSPGRFAATLSRQGERVKPCVTP